VNSVVIEKYRTSETDNTRSLRFRATPRQFFDVAQFLSDSRRAEPFLGINSFCCRGDGSWRPGNDKTESGRHAVKSEVIGKPRPQRRERRRCEPSGSPTTFGRRQAAMLPTPPAA
jgi:hypothetical protein